MKNRNGFTLIELLVVIALIALLLSILTPALSRSRQQAKAAVCLSNLGQWGFTFHAYTEDWNSKFPMCWHGWEPYRSNPDLKRKTLWVNSLRPYYSDVGDFRLCPAAKDSTAEPFSPTRCWGPMASNNWIGQGNYGSYGINGWISQGKPDDERYWRYSTVKHAYNIPLIGDHYYVWSHPRNTDFFPEAQDIRPASQLPWFCVNRHRFDLQLCFLDGSARAVKPWELWSLKWSRVFETQSFARADLRWLIPWMSY